MPRLKKKMATYKKRDSGLTAPPQLFYIGRQLPPGVVYAGVPGDQGVIIKMIGGRNDEKMIRLYDFKKFTGKKKWECGRCGLNFISEFFREAHGRARHSGRPGRIVKNMEDLSPEQKEILKAEAGRPGLDRTQDGYFVDPNEFNTPDPGDHDVLTHDQRLSQEMHWDKTEASRH